MSYFLSPKDENTKTIGKSLTVILTCSKIFPPYINCVQISLIYMNSQRIYLKSTQDLTFGTEIVSERSRGDTVIY